ncbi:MAG: hypothetical protein ACOC2M_04655, partial [bacterium]
MKTFFKKSYLVLLVAILFCHPLMAQEFNGDIFLETQADVDTFNYTSVTGNMRIIDNPNLDSEFHITSLAARSRLTEIGGNLYVSCHIGNFNGLHNLVSIGGDLNIAFMGVPDMIGLGSLETIGGSFIFDPSG